MGFFCTEIQYPPGFYLSIPRLGSQHEPLLERAPVAWGKKMALYLDRDTRHETIYLPALYLLSRSVQYVLLIFYQVFCSRLDLTYFTTGILLP